MKQIKIIIFVTTILSTLIVNAMEQEFIQKTEMITLPDVEKVKERARQALQDYKKGTYNKFTISEEINDLANKVEVITQQPLSQNDRRTFESLLGQLRNVQANISYNWAYMVEELYE